ncbi:helix-turn-helix transcriptional regulator [Fictibacillus sp. JL2B1089]|uniref:helix-turn-helix transcriptional regulator n=1 Tax=Fictibacillus sp. JL2B1089 TaxID=3399565 RepID=UPI003A864EAE
MKNLSCPFKKNKKRTRVFFMELCTKVMHMEIVCILDEIIKKRGLKKGFIAKKAQVSNAAFSLILKGKSIPTLPVAMRIAEVMDLSVEEIWIKKEPTE